MSKPQKPAKPARGRPVGSLKDPATKKDKVNVTLLPKHKTIAALAGDGVVSKGIGVALDAWAKKNPKIVVDI
jgi:hypothetical protein